MNSRKYNNDPVAMLEEGKLIMSSSDESKYLFRVFAVNMVLSGLPASQIAAMAGVSKVAVTRWVKSVDEKGFQSLRTKTISGRPSKLTEGQMNTIDTALQSNPNGYGFKVWDGPSLTEFIKNTFDIELSVRQCQRLFHKLGFSHIRPQTFPSKGYEETEERKAFKKNRES